MTMRTIIIVIMMTMMTITMVRIVYILIKKFNSKPVNQSTNNRTES